MNWSPIPASWSAPLLSVLRIVSGLLFFAHGVSKILAFPPAPFPVEGLSMVAGYFELVFGALILLGLFTRISAFLMSGQMALGYWLVHFAMGPLPVANNGDAAILFCFVFLYIAAAGPGPWSIDAARSKTP
jgi:putative oxidoreductase